MKTSVSVGSAYYNGEDWDELVDYVVAADRMGVDQVATAEGWGMDAIVPLAYLAAKTRNIRLVTGIMQISARVPAMMAMTAQSLDTVSKGRFILGLGVSGPQVVEGLHGVAFDRPVARLRECVAILRMALAGEKLEFDGRHYSLPRAGGEGKALRLSQAPRPGIPIYLATLGPKALQMTGEIADGWLGSSFLPEHADVFLDHIRAGAAGAGRSLADIDIRAGGHFEIGEDVERLVDERRPDMAFRLGAMGSAKTNFYNDAYCRAGFEDDARAVQELWVAGQREAAARRVPADLVLMSHLVGTRDMVRDRVRAYRDAGVTTLNLFPGGKTWRERTAVLEEAVDLVADAGRASDPA